MYQALPWIAAVALLIGGAIWLLFNEKMRPYIALTKEDIAEYATFGPVHSSSLRIFASHERNRKNRRIIKFMLWSGVLLLIILIGREIVHPFL